MQLSEVPGDLRGPHLLGGRSRIHPTAVSGTHLGPAPPHPGRGPRRSAPRTHVGGRIAKRTGSPTRLGTRRSMGERDLIALIGGIHQLLKPPIVLVWDRLNSHDSHAMSELIAERGWLAVFLLPAYPPGPNRSSGCGHMSSASWSPSPSHPRRLHKPAPAWPSTVQPHPDEPHCGSRARLSVTCPPSSKQTPAPGLPDGAALQQITDVFHDERRLPRSSDVCLALDPPLLPKHTCETQTADQPDPGQPNRRIISACYPLGARGPSRRASAVRRWGGVPSGVRRSR